MVRWKDRALEAESALRELRNNPLRNLDTISFSKDKWLLKETVGAYFLNLKKGIMRDKEE